MPTIKAGAKFAASFQKDINRAIRRNRQGYRKAVKGSTTIVSDEVDNRVFLAKYANRQDNPHRFSNTDTTSTGKRLTGKRPVSQKSSTRGGIIRLKHYRGKLRSNKGKINRVLSKFVKQHGEPSDTRRTGLRVNVAKALRVPGLLKRDRRRLSRARKKGINFVSIQFKGRQSFRRWGLRRTRGLQAKRHNVPMDATVREKLVAIPAVNKVRKKVEDKMINGALSGLDSKF